jgi:hypothetical protein
MLQKRNELKNIQIVSELRIFSDHKLIYVIRINGTVEHLAGPLKTALVIELVIEGRGPSRALESRVPLINAKCEQGRDKRAQCCNGSRCVVDDLE